MEHHKSHENDFAPFGNPDGSRADITDVMRRFVSFGGSSIWGGLATREDDLTARILVGRKGAGKTVYLRRLQAYASTRSDIDVVTDDIQQDLPTTEMVVTFCNWFAEATLTERWMQVWRRAIIGSLLTQLLKNTRLQAYISTKDKEQLAKFFRNTNTAQSVYSELRTILVKYSTRASMVKYLDNPDWDDLGV